MDHQPITSEVPLPTPTREALPEGRFHDRELSWLDFNQRVLDLAEDAQRVPLLERARFLAISASNLDEWFMVRLAGLKRRIQAGVAVPSPAGILPRDLHAELLRRVRDMAARQYRLLIDDIRPALAAEHLHLLSWTDLSASERERLAQMFTDRIEPVLTPLAVDPAHPFPYVSGLSVNLAVLLAHPQTGHRQFARVKVPTVVPRLVTVDAGRYLPVEQLIGHHLDEVFVGLTVLEWSAFRVTRNEDLQVGEDDAENLLDALEQQILRRRSDRTPVRLEVEEGTSPEIVAVLTDQLGLCAEEVFTLPGPLDLSCLADLRDVGRDDLAYPAFLPTTHPTLAGGDTGSPAELFESLRDGEVLLHHPYDSFATSVQRFVEQAAADPQVLAIKQTLYRTAGDSPIVHALMRAAEAGKQVLVVVEIMARFDEERNIHWARRLERAGCHVVYGIVGLKTHAKLCLVVRDEPDGLRRYAHIGTGNYHHRTARTYADLSLLTADPAATDDIARLFNHLSALTRESRYRRLTVAPEYLRDELICRIGHEEQAARQGRPSGIRIKVNALIDEQVVDALYQASRAGVPIDLLVRGACTLRPGVPGLSETIRVRSILGRFLEHSRAYWFANEGEPIVRIGSPDLMHRNLDRRVEALVDLTDPGHRATVADLFDFAFSDATASWRLQDATWTPHTLGADGSPLIDPHTHLIEVHATRKSEAR